MYQHHVPSLKRFSFLLLQTCLRSNSCSKFGWQKKVENALALLLPRGFSRSEYSNQQSSFGQCKISFDRVLVREKLFLKNGNSYIKSDEYSWDNILRANFCRKVTFGLWPFLWSNLAIFDFDGHFHPSNGGKDRQDSAHSCPRGWRRLPQKKSVRAIKLTDVALKVWDTSLAITTFGHHFEGFFLWKILITPFIDILVQYLHSFKDRSYKKVKRISEQATNNKK